MRLLRELRGAIAAGRLAAFTSAWRARYGSESDEDSSSSNAVHSPA
jgi:hypothetical protein